MTIAGNAVLLAVMAFYEFYNTGYLPRPQLTKYFLSNWIYLLNAVALLVLPISLSDRNKEVIE